MPTGSVCVRISFAPLGLRGLLHCVPRTYVRDYILAPLRGSNMMPRVAQFTDSRAIPVGLPHPFCELGVSVVKTPSTLSRRRSMQLLPSLQFRLTLPPECLPYKIQR